MSDAPQQIESTAEDSGADPQGRAERAQAALAAAAAAQAVSADRLENLGITSTEVRLWCEARGPKSHGVNVRDRG